MILIVGTGETYTTIQQALDALPEDDSPVTIRIQPGIYEEKLVITRGNIRFIGSKYGQSVITYGDYATKKDEYGRQLGTFRTATVLVLASDVYFENVTIQNHAGPGSKVGQAVALFLNNDRVHLNSCRIIGYQDTLLCGPIPHDAQNQEFLEFPIAHDALYRYLFDHCYIEGDIDFIFGSGNAVFHDCEVHSNGNGYVTAASTLENHDGFIFIDCQFTGDSENCTTYLGRPWRDYAHTVFIDCYMGSHLHPDGIARWNDTTRHLSSRYYEYGSYGPGANNRSGSLLKRLEESEAEGYRQMVESEKSLISVRK